MARAKKSEEETQPVEAESEIIEGEVVGQTGEVEGVELTNLPVVYDDGHGTSMVVRLGSIVVADYNEMIEVGTSIATRLKDVVDKQNLSMMLNTKNGPKYYVKVEGWQTLASMVGVSPVEVMTSYMSPTSKAIKSTYNVIRLSDLAIVGTGSMIMSEDEWAGRPEYARFSMCQTRAIGKALRDYLAWIISIAGYEPTPAEEMLGITNDNDDVIEGTARPASTQKPKSSAPAPSFPPEVMEVLGSMKILVMESLNVDEAEAKQFIGDTLGKINVTPMDLQKNDKVTEAWTAISKAIDIFAEKRGDAIPE